MKKSFLIAAGAALVAIAVSVFVYVNNGKNETEDLFYANVEALAGDEGGGVVDVPCTVAPEAICYFTVTDAEGNVYSGSISGMKNGR